MWPDLAKFHHLDLILKGFVLFLTNYLVFVKIVNLLWQIFHTYGQIFFILTNQILKWQDCHSVTLVAAEAVKG